MAKSISQAQADALASGFFDSLGTDKSEEFTPRKTLGKFILIAGKIIERANENLNKSDRVSSGALIDSHKITDPVKTSKEFRIDITALYYYKFIDMGVKGFVSKTINSPYSFKNLYVGGKMLKNLQKWLRKEGLKAKTNVGGKPISSREKRRSKITDKTKSTAYAIGRSVKAKGLKRTNYFSNALKYGNKLVKDELGKSLKVDVIESIPKKL